jgi:hypothetical protein
MLGERLSVANVIIQYVPAGLSSVQDYETYEVKQGKIPLDAIRERFNLSVVTLLDGTVLRPDDEGNLFVDDFLSESNTFEITGVQSKSSPMYTIPHSSPLPFQPH